MRVASITLVWFWLPQSCDSLARVLGDEHFESFGRMSLVSNHHGVESKLSRATGVAGAVSIRSVEIPGRHRFSGRELTVSFFVEATDERQRTSWEVERGAMRCDATMSVVAVDNSRQLVLCPYHMASLSSWPNG